MIQAKIIADSIDPRGNRLTTFVVTFPRIILAEFNTHRMFSRNSASSRAIPFEKIVKSVEENWFTPTAFQKHHKGMQGNEYFLPTEENYYKAKANWNRACESAIEQAKSLYQIGVTKQLCNRLLEPFMWHTVIVTSGEEGLRNFFELRCPQYDYLGVKTYRSKKDLIEESKATLPIENVVEWLKHNKGQSEIHMMALAEAMWDTYNESTPKQLRSGEWHILFGDDIDVRQVANLIPHYQEINGEIRIDNNIQQALIKIATARCARVSYTVVGEEGKAPNYENDIKLYDRLLESKHLSPFEHCAKVMTDDEYNSRLFIGNNGQHGWCKKFRGFIQQRYFIE